MAPKPKKRKAIATITATQVPRHEEREEEAEIEVNKAVSKETLKIMHKMNNNLWWMQDTMLREKRK